MPSTHGGHCPFPYAVIISVLNLLHHSCTVLEADFVGCSHLSSGSIAHAVKYLVEYIICSSLSEFSNGMQRALNSSENSAE